MNFKTPRGLSIFISTLLSTIFFLFILIVVFITKTNLSWIYFFLCYVLSILISSFILEKIITRFIHDRIKIIQRTIKRNKSISKSIVNLDSKEDVLENMGKEVHKWALEKNNEIKELEEKESYRQEFIGNLAHELKTPIFNIQGYVLTLLEGGLEDENINRRYLEKAAKSTERMIDMIEDLDEISQYNTGQLSIQKTKNDILEISRETIEDLEIPAQEVGISLQVDDKGMSSLNVMCDRKKIKQVLTNLMSNAIKYGKEDGKVLVKFFDMDDTILVEIADNGVGIESKHVPRLFERFYRVEASRNRDKGGSGLGLAIVKHIIEAHNQTINVRSTIGMGSTFSFTLEKA